VSRVTARRAGIAVALAAVVAAGLVAAQAGAQGSAAAEAACLDRSESPDPWLLPIALHLWAGEARRVLILAASGRVGKTVIFTGAIGPDSYRNFTLFPPIVIPAFPAKPSNPFAGKNDYETRRAAILRGVRSKVAALERLDPERMLGTDLLGCILKASELGVDRLFVATDLQPYGPQQSLQGLDLHNVRVSLLFDCLSDNAAKCRDRSDAMVATFRRAGATVHLIDPAEVNTIHAPF